ncbi:MAG TPA: UDP-N-acetylmuramate dehydrogenase [Bryobacteraceae bacterium]|nr:UDP-N-acetylmuramate dehydrogenase [Bryobacteraceae bacterium]
MAPAESVLNALDRISTLENVSLRRDVPLSEHTRFGIGGPADFYVQTSSPASFAQALAIVRSSGLDWVVIGGGTNLIVSDEGFRGVCLKLTSDRISADGLTVEAESGAVLQNLVDFTVDRGMAGLHTMTGIPGSVGAAVYGNAGAYGHSIQERVRRVRFLDGETVREFANAECRFHYRESIFKRNKQWIIISTTLEMEPGDAAELRKTADGILAVRNRKYPPTMRCAGSIFKNFLLAELPPAVAAEIPAKAIIEGKVPSAWFLEQVGAKGMKRGGIEVADYHANLIYNAGGGTARDLVAIVTELKDRIRRRWDISLEEEVQYVGFAHSTENSEKIRN